MNTMTVKLVGNVVREVVKAKVLEPPVAKTNKFQVGRTGQADNVLLGVMGVMVAVLTIAVWLSN
jgi:hypothetical protein